MKNTSNYNEIIEKRFVAFCKAVLRNEARDIYAENKRWSEKFISFDEINRLPLNELCIYDNHEVDFHTYNSKVVLIKDELIAEALATLSQIQQDVILHSFFLQMTDRAIGKLMGIDRSTIHYHKKRALCALRKFIEEETH